MSEKLSERNDGRDTALDVLIVDDDEKMRTALAEVLHLRGAHVLEAPDGRRAIEVVEREPLDIVVLDVNMPGLDGIETLKRIKSRNAGLSVTMLTGFGDVETAVEAMKLGADDFLLKPFSRKALEELLDGFRQRKGLRPDSPATPGAAVPDEPYEIVTRDPAMRREIEFVDRIAPFPSSVLIQGESGTGKELVARRIHRFSGCGDTPFIAFNCAAIPEHLLESELFGHERGAFTGADTRKVGYFEAAKGGTLFIDEISEMSFDLQTKLLRVLQERTFRRVGGIEELTTDARIVAATNRDLEEEIAAGRFRKDLYYRINVLKVSLPPLRERPIDIQLLCEHFIAKYSRRIGIPVAGIEFAARECLARYRWDGNVRELQNVIERAVVLAAGREIAVDDLPEELRRSGYHGGKAADGAKATEAPIEPYQKAKLDFEAAYVVSALQEARGNVALASRLTGIARQHFYEKMARYGLTQEEFRRSGGAA